MKQTEYVPTGVDWQFTVENRYIERAKKANGNVFETLRSIDSVILNITNKYEHRAFHD